MEKREPRLEYATIIANGDSPKAAAEKLVEMVQAAIEQGWVPRGGVTLACDFASGRGHHYGAVLVQAMTRHQPIENSRPDSRLGTAA